MTEQKEMNDRLLEFAGFKHDGDLDHWATIWISPDGVSYNQSAAPNFFDEDTGMPLLFKWVIPLISYYELIRYPGELHQATIYHEFNNVIEIDKSPTVALATACYKAVEECER